MSEENLSTELQIKMYLHCKQCFAENAHPQMLEVGFTEPGIQVWCKRHQVNVMHMALTAEEKANAKV
jgi:hypothetical protein